MVVGGGWWVVSILPKSKITGASSPSSASLDDVLLHRRRRPRSHRVDPSLLLSLPHLHIDWLPFHLPRSVIERSRVRSGRLIWRIQIAPRRIQVRVAHCRRIAGFGGRPELPTRGVRGGAGGDEKGQCKQREEEFHGAHGNRFATPCQPPPRWEECRCLSVRSR